jgi:hypothetical protein
MKINFKLVFVSLTSLLLAACAAGGDIGAQAFSFSTPNDHLIVPGQRIGPVTLGMSDKALFKLSTPYTTTDSGTWMMYQYPDLRIYVAKSTHKVVAIELLGDTSYHTAGGVKIGLSLQDVETALGPPDSEQSNPFFGNKTIDVHYTGRTLAIDFSKPGASMADAPERSVQTIGIQSPSTNLF